MKYLLLIVILIILGFLFLTACTMQTPVTGIVAQKEVFLGTATRTYPSSSGLLSVTSDKGILCTGKFSYYKGGNKGSGKFSFSDGRQGTYKYVVSGHEGHGVGQTTKGEDVEFYFNKQK